MRLVIVRRRIGNILIPGVGFFTFFELWNAFNIILHIYLFIYLYARDEYILKLIHYNFVLWYYSFVRSIKRPTPNKDHSTQHLYRHWQDGSYIHIYCGWNWNHCHFICLSMPYYNKKNTQERIILEFIIKV